MSKKNENPVREPSTWESFYRGGEVESLPWYYPGLDPDFDAELDSRGVRSGEALDLCTGPGTQAAALAERGLSVTATDISRSAIRKAARLATERGLTIVFRQNDIMDNRLEQIFDFVIDRGCYHVFAFEQRQKYVAIVAGLLKPGGILLLKCFSNREGRRDGPQRIAPAEIKRLFSLEFEVESIRHTVFQSASDGPEPKALFSILKKRER